MSTPTSLAEKPSKSVPPLAVAGGLAALVALSVLAIVIGLRGDDALTDSPIRGSGVPAVEERQVPAFTAVDLQGANDVTVRVGEAQSVTVAADDNLVGVVTTDVRDGVLVIASTTDEFSTVSPMSVDLTVPDLSEIALSGSGKIAVRDIRRDELVVSLAGDGSIDAVGAVTRLRASLTGTGNLDLDALTADQVEATLSGTGEIRVHATESLDGEVSGVGRIEYGGNPPNVTRTVDGVGAVTGS